MLRSGVHSSNILQAKQVTFRNIYAYKYMHISRINEKQEHDFEGEKGDVYGRVW